MSAHRMSQRPSTRLLTAILTASLAWAQTPQTPPSSSPVPPTLRVTTHMVLVDAVVTDKQGKAIPNLHADDFIIEENGKQQKITSVSSAAEKIAPPAQLPPGIY